MPSRVVESIDTYQRDHRWLGFPLAVAYKFGDDQGPYLTTLITYYGFLSPRQRSGGSQQESRPRSRDGAAGRSA